MSVSHALFARRLSRASVAGLALLACAPYPRDSLPLLEEPGRAAVATTNGRNASMLYVARVDPGVIVIDLGWRGAESALRGALRRLGASERDVVAVFLTHSHRDHIGAWRAVSRAPFYVAAPEVDLLLGAAEHRGWVPRLADRMRRARGPRAGELELRPFADDTSFVFGRDTVRAFVVPGHTAGSAAYLVRGVLFAGDAVSHTSAGRLRLAKARFSADADLARRSLGRLLAGLAAYDVRVVCTAHARCARFDTALRERLSTSDRGRTP